MLILTKTQKLNSIKGLVLIFALGIFILYACKKDKLKEPTPDTTPAADFTTNTKSITVGGTVNFTDLSTNTPTSWAWDFGDGDTSTLQNPSHIYSTTGTYTVSLTATNAYGSDTQVKTSYITVTTWVCGDPFTDSRDGQTYQTVQIGTQCWMAENLNVGTQIPPAGYQTNNGIIEKYCHGGVNGSSTEGDCSFWGGLYQWDEMMQYDTIEGTQGICPTGWHIPTDAEWCILENFVDTTTDPVCSLSSLRGTDGGTKLKQGGSSGFEAFLAGYFNNQGYFSFSDTLTWLWSSTEIGTDAWLRSLDVSEARVSRITEHKIFGFSVRCIKD